MVKQQVRARNIMAQVLTSRQKTKQKVCYNFGIGLKGDLSMDSIVTSQFIKQHSGQEYNKGTIEGGRGKSICRL